MYDYTFAFSYSKTQKRYANNASYGDGHTKDALVVTLVTTRRRCALRSRKGSDISAKIVCIRDSYRQKWQSPIILEAG